MSHQKNVGGENNILGLMSGFMDLKPANEKEIG